jgi:cell wall-associated NlpC family hydrolase
MRRGAWLVLLGALAAALGAASAYAAGTTTTATTTSTTTTSSTTTTTTTTATTAATTTTVAGPAYTRLPPSYLPVGCVGAGSAAIAEPGRPIIALGTPAADLGSSAYPATAPIVRFLSATETGSGCKTTHVTLDSVSLFGGAVTARTVAATHGDGTVRGFKVYGSRVTLSAGHPVRVGGWGLVTLSKTVGRLTAPLVVQLLAAHHSLPAGTTIVFAFGASPRAVDAAKPSPAHGSNSDGHGKSAGKPKKKRQSAKPPPDFPATASPFAKDGDFTAAATANPVVSIALEYLGIRYQWGGAKPSTGFDCSGLVKYVFAQLGVPLIHFAAAQWHAPGGVWVAPNRLRAGDLVFFIGSDGTRKEPGHVGIYVDDGYFIDAPHTGSFVRVDSLTERKFANEYVGARRFVGISLDRHLLHVTKSNGSDGDVLLDVPSPLRTEPLDEAAGIAAVVPASAHVSGPTTNVPLLVGGPLSGLLALTVIAGALAFRRRRTAPDRSS